MVDDFPEYTQSPIIKLVLKGYNKYVPYILSLKFLLRCAKCIVTIVTEKNLLRNYCII